MTAPAHLRLPLDFDQWLPAAQAVTLGLLTFVQEDIPTVSAALLAAGGSLSWQAGFLGVFLGIWMGDALLYLVARSVGRPLLQRSWAQRFLAPAAVARSERWFGEKGTWVLLGSRFVPGTRLPTYLAAGFLRFPFGRFLLVTGMAVAAWTAGIFLLARTFGAELMSWVQRWSSGGWAVVLVVIGMTVALRLSFKLSQRTVRRRVGAAFGRCLRWEFWPAWLFYLPVGVNCLRLGIRHRGFTVPTAANPGIFSGGFVGESKMDTLRDLLGTSPEFTAEAFLIPAGRDSCTRVGAMNRSTFPLTQPLSRLMRDRATLSPEAGGEGSCGGRFMGGSESMRLALFEQTVREHDIGFPLVLKPDVGQRGVGVKIIHSLEQAAAYLKHTAASLVVQRYVPGPHEVGVFYYRFPHETRGHIFAITEKIFPTITGDGRLTIEELVWRDERARYLADKYLSRLGERASEVLAAGERLKLVEAGNHAQGCIFRDGFHLWTEELERRIDEISQRLDGFFIGRYDIRYASEEDLRAGRNFQIIELNGAASEATSIYDSRHSLFTAYRTLFRQWELVFAIGAANRRRGCPPVGPMLLWRKWRETTALVATYPSAD